MTVSPPIPEPAAEPRVLAPATAGPDDVAAPAETAIALHGAGKCFGETWVLRHLNFMVESGTIFGLFGPSGSGKTTIIRLMLGLLVPDEGEISVLGTSPRRFGTRTRARIGYMPQLFVLYPELSVLDNLHFVASLYGLGWLKRRRLMRQALDLVDLWEHRRKGIGQLSGGMQRRLELATALVHNPQLLVVDEPTAGVDPVLRAKFWDHFRELRDQGRTIVVTSQYVTEAEYCDRVAFLGRGELVALGTPDQVRQQALGGEVVEVIADGLDRRLVEQLRALEGVRGVRRVSYEELQLTVDQATAVIAPVLTVLTEGGAEVKQVQEARPNFDEVFVQLMEQSKVESVE
jgi:ABC-2 type transport system ATP-binding protein